MVSSDVNRIDREFSDEADQESLATLFTEYRSQLRRMVDFRMDRRLAGRIDSSDVVQQAYIEAQSRIHHFRNQSTASPYLWLRQITQQTLIDLHRRHLLTKNRDIKREIPINAPGYADSAVYNAAERLAGQVSSPSQAAMHLEMVAQLRQALNDMDNIDREVLLLRHFEEMGNRDVAEVLGIGEAAASNRYVRALKRLKQILNRSSSV